MAPAGAVRQVLDDHALGRELVADAVGLSEVLAATRLGARLDQALDLRGVQAGAARPAAAIADLPSRTSRPIPVQNQSGGLVSSRLQRDGSANDLRPVYSRSLAMRKPMSSARLSAASK